MRTLSTLLILLTISTPALAAPPAGWDLATCSRSVVRCNADVDAATKKIAACDAQRLSDGRAWSARLEALMQAHSMERETLRSEVFALRARLKAPAPWWSSPAVWGAAGIVIGGVGAALAVHHLGRTQ